jgi:hypothetical protein
VIFQSVTGPGSYDADGYAREGGMEKSKKRKKKPKKEQILVRDQGAKI